MDGLIVQTNAMLAEQAVLNGAEFVDTYDDSVGHDVCTPPGTRWYEGLVPTAAAFPLHPNALGHAELRALGAARARPAAAGARAERARARRAIDRGGARRCASPITSIAPRR